MSEWTNVEEELPEGYETVLMCQTTETDLGPNTQTYFLGWYDPEHEKFYSEAKGKAGDFISNITHWQPLPEPPTNT